MKKNIFVLQISYFRFRFHFRLHTFCYTTRLKFFLLKIHYDNNINNNNFSIPTLDE